MAANSPPRLPTSKGYIRLRVSQTRSVDIGHHATGSGTIVFFKGTPALAWVTVFGNGRLLIEPEPTLQPGRYEMQVEAISIFGTATRTYIIHIQNAIRPRWKWGRSHTEYLSENALDNWNLQREVSGDGTITLSKISGPTWTEITGFILTSVPPEIREGEYEDFVVVVRATSEWGTRDTEITLRIFNDGQITLTFQLPEEIEEIGEGKDFRFDASDFVSRAIGAVTYHKERGSDWLSIDESTGIVTGTAPLVNANENHYILIEVRDSNGFQRESLRVLVLNGVITPPGSPDTPVQWGTIPPQPIDELKAFSFPVRSYLTGTTTASFTKHSGPAWVSVDTDGTVRNTTGQTPPDVAANTDVTIGIRATVGTTTYDTTFTLTVRHISGRDPTSNAPPVIAGNIPEQHVDELTYFEFSIDSYVSGGESGGAIVISKTSGPPWLTITGSGVVSGTPKAVPSQTRYTVTFDAISVFGSATNGRFTLVVRDVTVTTEPPTWREVPLLYANEFSRFNRNIRRYVQGSGIIILEKVSGPAWISISTDGQRLTGTTPRVSQQEEHPVSIRARSAYGTAVKTLLFIIRDSLNPATRLTFKPPARLTLNENTMRSWDMSSYVTGATGTVRYQVNHAPAGVRFSGASLTFTAGEVDNTEHHAVFLRATDDLGGVTAILTLTIRNTTGGGISVNPNPTARAVPRSTGALQTTQFSSVVDQVVYSVYLYETPPAVQLQTAESILDLSAMGRQVTGGTWVKFPDEDILDYGTITFSLDAVSVNEYRVGQATLTLRNPDNRYSPKNPDNFFKARFGNALAYGVPVYIEAGYHTPLGVRVERIFEGIVLNLREQVGDMKVTMILSDDAQYLRQARVDDFGLTKRFLIEFAYVPETEQGAYPLFQGFTPLSEKSVVARYPTDLVIEDILKHEGELSSRRLQADVDRLLTETLNPEEITRYQLEMKTPYRHKRVETLIQELATAAAIPADRQTVRLPEIHRDAFTFATLGRPDYDILHDYEQVQTRALTEFRWEGHVTAMHYDAREEHDIFYFLLSAPQHNPDINVQTEPTPKEIAESRLQLDANFGPTADNYQKSQHVQDAFGVEVNYRPKLIQYDREKDTWSEVAARLTPAEWWAFTPNADYTEWYVLGTEGINETRFLEPARAGGFVGQIPDYGTYDAAEDGNAVFIEKIEVATGNVTAFLDASSTYPPQLAHFYHVGYGLMRVGQHHELEIVNQGIRRSYDYFRDGIRPDSRRPLRWHNDRLYYPFARGTGTTKDFGIASTADGLTSTAAFTPIPMDRHKNHMGFAFDIKSNGTLEFAFTVVDGLNSTLKIVRLTL